MSAHTPGPWLQLAEEVDRDYIRIRGTKLGGRYKIANVITPSFSGVSQRETEETRCNARLIAAAPDLLDALRLYIDWCVAEEDHRKAAARAAVAKATGEQQ